MKNKKYHTVGRFLKYKIVERGKIGTLTLIYMNAHFHLVICTAIKSGGVKLVLKA
jgi:hypothetical protein